MKVRVTLEVIDSEVEVAPQVFEADMASVSKTDGMTIIRDSENEGKVLKRRNNGQVITCIKMWTGCDTYESFTTD